MLERERIPDVARQILENYPEGLRHKELLEQLQREFAYGIIQVFIKEVKERKVKGVRKNGNLYKLRGNTVNVRRNSTRVSGTLTRRNTVSGKPKKEKFFYEPFADWLMSEGKCGEAMQTAGRFLNRKWGTPDVMGTKPRRGDTARIISAEIKTRVEGDALVTAFGQACAYKLFSHDVYLVIPRQSAPEDIDRIKKLCRLHKINLVLFNNKKSHDPEFDLCITQESRQAPDGDYVSQYEEKLYEWGLLLD
jgi:hypothetical protein